MRFLAVIISKFSADSDELLHIILFICREGIRYGIEADVSTEPIQQYSVKTKHLIKTIILAARQVHSQVKC